MRSRSLLTFFVSGRASGVSTETAEHDDIRIVVASAGDREFLAVPRPRVCEPQPPVQNRSASTAPARRQAAAACICSAHCPSYCARYVSERPSGVHPRLLASSAGAAGIDLFFDGAVFQLLHHDLRLCTGSLPVSPSIGDQFTVRRNLRGELSSAGQFDRCAAIDGDLENVAQRVTRLGSVVHYPFAIRRTRTLLLVLPKSELLQLARRDIQTPQVGYVVLQ